MTQLQALLATPAGLALVAALAVLALLFLALWLGARGGGGDAAKDAKAQGNQLRLLKGDMIQKQREHDAALAQLAKERDNWKAQAGGQLPPELEEWRKRAVDAEGRLKTEVATLTERHKKEVGILEAALGKSSVTGTIIAPSSAAVRDRMDRMEKDLAEAQAKLDAQAAAHRQELAALADRLGAEKAAAIMALSGQLEAARRGGGDAGAAAGPSLDAAALAGDGSVPESARFPYLEVVAGGPSPGVKHFLPFGTITIGRADTCTIPIEDSLASRNHAEVAFDGVDFRVRDNGSTNGTSVNDKAVPSARLDFGDVIGIGEFRFRFSCAAADAAGANPAFAEAAYTSMVKLAPDFRPALRELAGLLEREPARAGDVQDLRERLAALPEARAAE